MPYLIKYHLLKTQHPLPNLSYMRLYIISLAQFPSFKQFIMKRNLTQLKNSNYKTYIKYYRTHITFPPPRHVFMYIVREKAGRRRSF